MDQSKDITGYDGLQKTEQKLSAGLLLRFPEMPGNNWKLYFPFEVLFTVGFV